MQLKISSVINQSSTVINIDLNLTKNPTPKSLRIAQTRTLNIASAPFPGIQIAISKTQTLNSVITLTIETVLRTPRISST